MQARNLTLRHHVPAHLIALEKSAQEYERVSGFNPAEGIRDFLLMASPEFFRSLKAASAPDPWRFGFAIIHTKENIVIGLCGFAGTPNTRGSVEIGYSIAPFYQGRGFATEVANALVVMPAAP